MQLVVIDHDHEILLGSDWFKETGGGFFPEMNRFKILERDKIRR